jgi:8-oxo-dGTP diphosphatase
MPTLPYQIAVLCYLFDDAGRLLLLHRRKPPNQHLYSPVGGKLEQGIGESPTTCAIREIEEETGLQVTASDLHLTGIVSEEGFDDQMHWLMFLYELRKPVTVQSMHINEGRLEWHDRASIDALPLPRTDREVIWPLFWRFRGGFFMVHICCRGGEMRWRLEQPAGEL